MGWNCGASNGWMDGAVLPQLHSFFDRIMNKRVSRQTLDRDMRVRV